MRSEKLFKPFYLTIVLVLTICIYSCRKDSPITTYSSSSLVDYFDDKREEMIKTFSFDAQTAWTYGDWNNDDLYGVSLNIDSNSFVYSDGQTVTGIIDLEYMGVITKKQMLLAKLPTQSNGQVLFSGGQIFLHATQNGEQIFLKPGKFVDTYISTVNYSYPDTGMTVFYGDQLGKDVNWISSDSSTQNTNMTVFVGPASAGYEININTPDLGWINVDMFPNGPRTEITLNTPEHLNADSTFVFAFFEDLNSLAIFPSVEQGISVGNGYPVGEDIILIFITQDNGQYYSSFTPVTITNDLHVSITPSPTTIETFEYEINNLND